MRRIHKHLRYCCHTTFEMSKPGPKPRRDVNSRRVLDEAARRRRARRALEALEQDNFHDDPHGDLVMSKKAPKFSDKLEVRGGGRKKKQKHSAEYYKLKYRKTFNQLVEEAQLSHPDPPNYLSAQAEPSNLPERHFCAVCGFPSNYTCIQCGTRYCCVRCLGTHQDTRCLKWTA